jgi:acyl-CoA synthetase (AMP-forming)/AMP-acid ligase II
MMLAYGTNCSFQFSVQRVSSRAQSIDKFPFLVATAGDFLAAAAFAPLHPASFAALTPRQYILQSNDCGSVNRLRCSRYVHLITLFFAHFAVNFPHFYRKERKDLRKGRKE